MIKIKSAGLLEIKFEADSEVLWLEVLLLGDNDVRSLTIDEAIEAVEAAFKEKELGRAQMPPKTYLFYKKYEGDLRVMPSYLEELDISGVKVVNVHPNNPRKYNLPSVMAIVVLVDPKNGNPISIMNGAYLTAMRTGAASGIATKYLARRESKILALIGAGVQARTQLMAIAEVLDLEEVRVCDKSAEAQKKFIEKSREMYPFKFVGCKSENCVVGADVISTTTPSTTPILKNDWIEPGMHINAIGADAPGKEELDPLILKRAKIVVDDWAQALHSGEVNVPLTKGIITEKDIFGELGEIIAGKKPRRVTNDEITIFDSTGLSIQDVTIATKIFKKAKARKLGKWIIL